jgi:hypothetical protein
MPKTKSGEVITWKEFGKRWKKGIEGITPLQQAKMAYKSTWITIVGILLGLVISAIAIKSLYWLFIILTGALFNTFIQQIANLQRWRMFANVEGQMKILMEQVEGGNQNGL